MQLQKQILPAAQSSINEFSRGQLGSLLGLVLEATLYGLVIGLRR